MCLLKLLSVADDYAVGRVIVTGCFEPFFLLVVGYREAFGR